ncbi:MAG: hypothetical protein HWD86_01760 [Kangiellaceae bacterium]|nr:hypothetical protein [Kangiellaceae bacterium]
MDEIQHLKIRGYNRKAGDLRRFLIKGGASSDARWWFRENDCDTKWKSLIKERIPFIEAVTDSFNLEKTRGMPDSSLYTYLSSFQLFIKFIDERDLLLDIDEDNLKNNFIHFDEYQYYRAWIKKEIKQESAYGLVLQVAKVIGNAVKLPEYKDFRYSSRVVKAFKHPAKVAISRASEKQHIGDSQKLGFYCVDIANSLTTKAVIGRLPIKAKLTKPDGTNVSVKLPVSIENGLKSERKTCQTKAKNACEPVEVMEYKDLDPYRRGLITLRILVELVIFVYQTGMNVTQVLHISRRGFSYKLQGHSDWLVTQNKARAGGPKSFVIYKDYKERFKEFIVFIDRFRPEQPYLFPLTRSLIKAKGLVNYNLLKKHLKRDKVPWIPPSKTRNTRVNFLNRLIDDANVSSEIAQHAKETFEQHYHKPSQQRAMTALTTFWRDNPINLIGGGCRGAPEPVDNLPSGINKPDCISQSGCLFCKNHRDVNSEDYVWSLVSFRQLKLIEAAQPVSRELPADITVERLNKKIETFKGLTKQSMLWVKEALLKVDEGNYHPIWADIIKFWEGK